MVGTNAVAVQVMPESPDTNLEEIKVKIKEKLTKSTNIQIEERDIAFGLKSLNLIVAWPENEDTDEIENIISGIDGVSSCKIEEVRRAFG
jgi:translation elongation factor aEF-1 beta